MLARFVVEVGRGSVDFVGSTTLAEFLDRWLDHIRPKRSPTIKGYRHKTIGSRANSGLCASTSSPASTSIGLTGPG